MNVFLNYLYSNRHFYEEVTNKSVELCESIAEEAHANHKRWNGDSYKHSHLTRIVNNIYTQDSISRTEETVLNIIKCVAWLHDVLEDCRDEGYDSHKLIDMGVPICVVQEVRHLTRLPGESYLPYIIRLCNSNSPIALIVKLLDIQDNLSDLDDYKNSARHRDCYELSRYIIESKWRQVTGGEAIWILESDIYLSH